MYKKYILGFLTISALLAGAYFYNSYREQHRNLLSLEEEGELSEEMRALFTQQRLLHEYNMLKDPKTGKIPAHIREEELAMARALPTKEGSGLMSPLSNLNLNTYLAAGPDNSGGRTRAVAYDKRFNGTTNQVIIAGGVSGGIMRSTDWGLTWTRVSPDAEIHNLTALAQDPRTGFENTWYAAGGESLGNSATAPYAYFYGYGIFKSTDNGITWTRLTLSYKELSGATGGSGAIEGFDNVFDIVHKIIVNPATGDVYVCGHRRLVRSTDGGASWNVVFAGATPANSSTGQMDIVCSNTGKLVLGVNGGFPDTDKRGVWTSTNGTSWTRISGGNSLGIDSVAEWRGNSYNGDGKRIVMAMAPSNQNLVYVVYDNGLSQEGSTGKSEADLYKLDMTGGNNTWANLTASVPDFPSQFDGVDPFAIQGGYDLMLAVKPDDANAVFLGGVNLFRSTNGFTTTAGTSWIGGYSNTGSSSPYKLSWYGSIANANDFSKWSHPDMHSLVFNPIDPNEAICANDGGLQFTDNIMSNLTTYEPVLWYMAENYQTTQFYSVAMDPGSGRNNFIGGAQDNGSRFRDASGVLNSTASGNSYYRLLSGDGGASGIAAKAVGSSSQFVYMSTQYGNIIRASLSTGTANGGSITPSGLTPAPGLTTQYGDFVTYFKLDFDNSEDLYYVNFNRLFRTTNASTVASGGWTELTGVSAAINPSSPVSGTNISISALELSRGAYYPSHVLYIGTSDGKIFRLSNPRNALAAAAPVNITPANLTGYVSDIAVNPNNDEEVMVVASNYNTTSVFWTNNAKSATPTWYNAEGNLGLPSMRSCMIAVKKDASGNPVTEYYLGTSVGLYSAVNIGPVLQGAQTLTWVREGASVLNYAIISALDYRPQDNTLLIGTHGNGMYYAQLGTPNFVPNQNTTTGINDPVLNDKNFIQQGYPTMAKDQLFFKVGNMYTVSKLHISIYNMNGQLVLNQISGYSNGALPIRHLAKGTYVLSINSNDQKQRYLKKFIKE